MGKVAKPKKPASKKAKATPKKAAPKKAAKKAKPKKRAPKVDMIVCSEHGRTRATFVCTHVVHGVACGFHANTPTPADPCPDAWCDLCEEAFQGGGGEWSEANEAIADIHALCTHCYAEARARNATLPSFASGATATLTDAEAVQLVHHAVHETQELQDKSEKRWAWNNKRWKYSSDAKTLTFSDPAGAGLVADVVLVGSFSTKSNTFQWAWQTLSEDDPSVEELSRLRTFGTVRGLEQLTTPMWPAEEIDGWEMTSVAAYLLGADTIYRAPFDHLYWFMLLRNWRRTKKSQRSAVRS